VQILESAAGTVTSTKQFVWGDARMCEERNSTGALISQFFPLGQTISGTSYFYTRDHLDSILEMDNSSGVTQAQYSYDSYGRVAKLAGSLDADFRYAGYYYHAPSGLSITQNRFYSPLLARWLNRDPIAERGGTNLYGYVANKPVSERDPSGLMGILMAPINPPSSDPPNLPSVPGDGSGGSAGGGGPPPPDGGGVSRFDWSTMNSGAMSMLYWWVACFWVAAYGATMDAAQGDWLGKMDPVSAGGAWFADFAARFYACRKGLPLIPGCGPKPPQIEGGNPPQIEGPK
jgi:RHS repeat-associated protein